MTPPGLIVDLFAGGGGASEGIRMALGRDPDIAVNHDDIAVNHDDIAVNHDDIAVNHDDDAVAVHLRNHPGTAHHCASVWRVEPLAATGGRPVSLLWASPDCRHFSRAAGVMPRRSISDAQRERIYTMREAGKTHGQIARHAAVEET